LLAAALGQDEGRFDAWFDEESSLAAGRGGLATVDLPDVLVDAVDVGAKTFWLQFGLFVPEIASARPVPRRPTPGRVQHGVISSRKQQRRQR
jgi:hypothetical protein